MAATPRYQFIIVDQSGNLYEFENCVKRAWEWYENDVGRCRFYIPKNDIKLSTTSVPDGAFSEIRVYRDGVLVWQGMTQIVQDTPEGTYVYGETYLAAFRWYSVRFQRVYTAENLATIIGGEYDDIAARSNNFLLAKITKGTIESPYTTSTTTPLTITRTLYHENWLDFLKQMMFIGRAEIASSFSQYTVFNISFSETTPTFSFLRDVGSNKPDVIFEMDSEVIEHNIPRDFRFIENEGKGFAVASGPIAINSTETDATSQTAFYRRESYPYYNNVTGQIDLDKRVNNRIAERKDPKRSMYLKFAAGLKPFDGYVMGDNVKIRIDSGRVDSDEYRRVVGMQVAIDDTGVEFTVPILQKARV